MGAAKKQRAETFTAENLVHRLRERFPAPAWATLTEVRNGTGFQRDARTADALSMSVWPSLGLEIHGFEVKVSRTDWKRELADPGKAAEIQRFCDRWWVVAAPGVVQAGELPPTWGLLEPTGKTLRATTEAPKLGAEPITRLFLASLFRSLDGQSPSQLAIEAAVSAERKRSAESFEQATAAAQRAGRHESDRLKKAIDEFETASGVRIDGWDNRQIGAAVKLVLRGGIEKQRRELEWIKKHAEETAENIRAALADYDTSPTPRAEVESG